MISEAELLKWIFSTDTVMCNPLRSFIHAQIEFKNVRLAVTSGSCGDVIKKTAAFISKKFLLILYLSTFFNQVFLLSEEGSWGANGGNKKDLGRNNVMYNVFLCVPIRQLSSDVAEKTKWWIPKS